MKCMEKNIMNKETKILIIIAIAVILIVSIGATYAYFKGQFDDELNLDINVSTNVNNLSFQIDGDITLQATKENFGTPGKNLTKEATAKAILTPNPNINPVHAIDTYNLSFTIDNNTFDYTTEDRKPEILLNIYGPNGEEKKETIGELTYIEGKGYDITTQTGTFNVLTDYPIETNTLDAITHTWTFKITLVNLDTNQKDNGGKSLNAHVSITHTPLEN